MNKCPICGAEMRPTRIGGGRRGEKAFICPVDESERKRDSHGHYYRTNDALHPWLRVWRETELIYPPEDL